MDTIGRVKMQCWKSQSTAWRKLPCFSSSCNFEMKRKLITLPRLLVSPPSCSLSMSPKVDGGQSDSAIPFTVLSESDPVLVHVRFVLQKECMFGERFYLVGDDPLLGLWDPSNGIPLDWSNDHIWSAQLQDVPIGKKVEFKFVLVGLSGEVQWQPGPNRILLLDQVITNTSSKASTITVCEDWDSAGNQTISLDDVAVSAEATVMQEEIEVSGPDQTSKTSENPESTQGDANSGIISNTRLEGSEPDRENHSEGMSSVSEPDRESHSEGMSSVSKPDRESHSEGMSSVSEPDRESHSEGISLVPGLNLATFPQENDSIEHLETADGDEGLANEMILDDCEDRSDNNGREELSIALEEVNLETTMAGILRNDLQWGQRALEDSTTVSILGNDLQWGRKALHDFISGLGFDFDKT
ncbi:Carbohydrate-binding-like fold [Rhynchospora pubera]|uniref:Carbohydrate-binding-like fold n=1 Tax=Rhynchospora pubera TaxID=906938 RepID=A0AAV8C8U1_9POAL|nr:Carbohydrate-binding-like fold [Rhynchospora pubera]